MLASTGREDRIRFALKGIQSGLRSAVNASQVTSAVHESIGLLQDIRKSLSLPNPNPDAAHVVKAWKSYQDTLLKYVLYNWRDVLTEENLFAALFMPTRQSESEACFFPAHCSLESLIQAYKRAQNQSNAEKVFLSEKLKYLLDHCTLEQFFLSATCGIESNEREKDLALNRTVEMICLIPDVCIETVSSRGIFINRLVSQVMALLEKGPVYFESIAMLTGKLARRGHMPEFSNSLYVCISMTGDRVEESSLPNHWNDFVSSLKGMDAQQLIIHLLKRLNSDCHTLCLSRIVELLGVIFGDTAWLRNQDLRTIITDIIWFEEKISIRLCFAIMTFVEKYKDESKRDLIHILNNTVDRWGNPLVLAKADDEFQTRLCFLAVKLIRKRVFESQPNIQRDITAKIMLAVPKFLDCPRKHTRVIGMITAEIVCSIFFPENALDLKINQTPETIRLRDLLENDPQEEPDLTVSMNQLSLSTKYEVGKTPIILKTDHDSDDEDDELNETDHVPVFYGNQTNRAISYIRTCYEALSGTDKDKPELWELALTRAERLVYTCSDLEARELLPEFVDRIVFLENVYGMKTFDERRTMTLIACCLRDTESKSIPPKLANMIFSRDVVYTNKILLLNCLTQVRLVLAGTDPTVLSGQDIDPAGKRHPFASYLQVAHCYIFPLLRPLQLAQHFRTFFLEKSATVIGRPLLSCLTLLLSGVTEALRCGDIIHEAILLLKEFQRFPMACERFGPELLRLIETLMLCQDQHENNGCCQKGDTFEDLGQLMSRKRDNRDAYLNA